MRREASKRGPAVPGVGCVQYEAPGIPVILTDVMESWGAMREWEPERLRHKYGETKMRVSALIATVPCHVTAAPLKMSNDGLVVWFGLKVSAWLAPP